MRAATKPYGVRQAGFVGKFPEGSVDLWLW